MAYAQPVSSGLSAAQIASLAEKFAQEIDYSPTNDLTETIERIGGEISYVDFWELKKTDSGSIKVEPDFRFRITLPNHTSPERDRFTVAHELGHFVLHFLFPIANGTKSKEEGLEAQRFGSGPTEYEANRFAASFLMPETAFRQAHAEAEGELEKVARHFSVSLSAAAVRAKALGLE